MQLLILRINSGNFTDGFVVSCQIREDQSAPSTDISGRLPPNPGLAQRYTIWKSQYCRLLNHPLGNNEPCENSEHLTLQGFQTNYSTHSDEKTCRDSAKALATQVKEWLQSSEMQRIRETAIAALRQHQSTTQLIIQLPISDPEQKSHDEQSILWRLPWHEWDILKDYPTIEPILAPLEYRSPPLPTLGRTQARILAISGEDDIINLEESIDKLKSLQNQGIEVKHLSKPSPDIFITTLRDEKGWDILFFTGHSGTNHQEGWIQINQSAKLEVNDFKHALQYAYSRGLKLTILSSCDGSDLAKDLADFNVPTIIAMRELIPHNAATQFIRDFLKEFTNRQDPVDLPMAVRRARQNLEAFTIMYPGATWLPMIFQRSPQKLPTWQELCFNKTHLEKKENLSLKTLKTSKYLFIALAIFGLTTSIREIGWIESVELSTFDQLMRLRPPEKSDPRITIITVDNIEGENKANQPYSISDKKLNSLLDEINKHNPFSIGLDIYRDKPTDQEEEFNALIKTMSDSGIIIPVCKVTSNINTSISPPPSHEKISAFGDLIRDSQDSVVRRSLLSLNSPIHSNGDPQCSTERSLGLALAEDYLFHNNGLSPELWTDNVLKIDNKKIFSIKNNGGAYRHLDSQGFQILLNYRAGEYPYVFNTISTKNILAGEFDSSLINERIILIGADEDTAKRLEDIHKTPYGEMPGVFIHAHITSQILNNILDNRPLLWSLPSWADSILTLIFTIIGIPFLIRIKRFSQFSFILIIGIGTATVVSFIALWQFGLWLPLVPAIIAFTGSSMSIWLIHEKS